MKLISDRVEHQFQYDPTTRPWYLNALKTNRSVFSKPYIFSSSKLPGITCACALGDRSAVFGMDITLSQLDHMLATQKVAQHGTLLIMDRDRRVVAGSGSSRATAIFGQLELPLAFEAADTLVRRVAEKMDSGGQAFPERPFILDVERGRHLVSLTPISQHGIDLIIAVAAPLDELTHYIGQMGLRCLAISLVVLLIAMSLGILAAKRISGSFGQLILEAQRIQRFDFSEHPPIRSRIKEIHSLIASCEVMKSTIQKTMEALVDIQAKQRKLVEAGLALSAEKDIAKLVTLIFQSARDFANADGGVMYLFEENTLGVELLSLHSESLVLGGLSEHPAPRVMVRPQIMTLLDRDSVLRYACEAFNTKSFVAVKDMDLSLFPTGLPEEPKDFPIRALIAVPIVTRQDKVLGVIQLFNPRHKETGEYLDSEHKEVIDFVFSLAAQAAVSLDNRSLIRALRDLFDGLIQAIAASIDSKSRYTAGHCTRVPELTEMLAREIHEAQEGPLKDFRLESEDEWRELWIAAWMHDCGKVSTPEYVVDKATKLETIYNRIHEIRMRFEVLRRDAELQYHRKLFEGAEEPAALVEALEQEFRRLDEDFTFIANCNVGGEFMSDACKERIKAIAKRTWIRHFSDRAGLSKKELELKEDIPESALPVVEPLLSDKPDQLIPRTNAPVVLKDAQGNPLNRPENEFNRGEMYNLCIERGTITSEERYKINEHVLNGLEMLKKIPFPASLSRVPEIASSHHETLVGSGYPFRKMGNQISVQARILTIADVFEALTARDRPYSEIRPLSQALRIMSLMRNDRHIDADIFEIFLSHGVYKRYAEKHLSPEQIDVDDISIYLNKTSG